MREDRQISQSDLAMRAGVSARHLSFVETGRARPSSHMVMHLADHLGVATHDRNRLLLAAGYAPVFERGWLEDTAPGPLRDVLHRALVAHEPAPAILVDRHWGFVAGNGALQMFTDGVAAHLLEPPVNVLRLALHPDGLAPRVANLPVWRSHMLNRLERDAVMSGDPALAVLHAELSSLPAGEPDRDADLARTHPRGLLRLRHPGAELAMVRAHDHGRTATVARRNYDAFPMRAFARHAGSWTGTTGFRLMPADPSHTAPATAHVSSAAAANLTTIGYTWSHPRDGPQDGLLAVGPAEEPDEVVALWGDSWHQSPAPKVLTGTIENGVIVVGYEYGGDWRWQITIDATDADVLGLCMDNVVPQSAAAEGLAAGPYAAMVTELRRGG